MKKVLSLVLALSMTLGSFGMAFADTSVTSDIEGHDNQEAIERLNDLGIVEGDDRGFAPDENITRAEFAVLLVRALGLEGSANAAKGDTQFTDVTVDAGYEWASGAINVASRLGYIEGHGNGMFAPADEITYEQAVTIIVRALGYRPAAEDKGGYPIGYLVVAEQDLDLDDNVTATQGLASTRGAVFQLLDNALTKPMMEQVGYGDDKSYEVNEDKTLLEDNLGFDKFEGRVIDFDAEDLEITVETEDGKEKLDVTEGFDFEEAFGLEITAWADDEDVISSKLDSEALLDAIEFDEDAEELTLVEADDDYEINKDAVVYVNGKEEKDIEDLADKAYDYAKVVLDEDDEVIFVDAYKWDGEFVVEEVDGDMVYGYEEEIDIEDYAVVKDGKTAEVEAGDIFFFNEDAEYAEIFNKTVEGELSRIFTDSFELDGDEYDIAGTYLDGNDLVDLNDEALRDMEEEGEVVVFVDRNDDVVFVSGDLGNAVTNSYYAYVLENTADFSNRGDDMWTLDVIDESGVEVNYDIKEDDITDAKADFYSEGTYADDDGDNLTDNGNSWEETIKSGAIVEVEVDEDGEVESVKLMAPNANAADDLKTDASYADGDKLSNNTVVFITEDGTDADDIIVGTFGDLDFDEITTGHTYVDNDKVEVIVASTTDRDSDYTEYNAVLVDDVDKVSGEDTWRLELNIDGSEDVYYTEEDEFSATDMDDFAKGAYLVVAIDDETNEIVKLYHDADVPEDLDAITGRTVTGTVYSRDVSDKEITFTLSNGNAGATFKLEDAEILDDDFDGISIRDIEVGDSVDILLVSNGSSYAKYAVVNPAPNNGGNNGGNVTGAVVKFVGSDSITVTEGEKTTTLQLADEVIVIDETVDPATTNAYAKADLVNNVSANSVIDYELGQVDKAVVSITIKK